jgi:hypothetical protein
MNLETELIDVKKETKFDLIAPVVLENLRFPLRLRRRFVIIVADRHQSGTNEPTKKPPWILCCNSSRVRALLIILLILYVVNCFRAS